MSHCHKKLLIIGYVWPEPNSSAAGTRMMQLIQNLQADHWHITFASPANLGEHKADLNALGIAEHNIELNHSSFDSFIQALQPGLVIFDRFMMEEQFGWRVAKQLPDTIRVLNTEDLHCLREARQQLVKDYLKTPPPQVDLNAIPLHDNETLWRTLTQSELAKREIASLLRCDLTLMISEFEMALLQQYFQVPASHLHYLPFLYDEHLQTTDSASLMGFADKQHFISIGNFRHAPNWDAVLWLKQSIWPAIRAQLPQAQLHIYGAYPPKKATELHNPKQGFLVLGWAEDALQKLTQARVCLAPLRFGAGIKGKLAEAMLCGTPSVTTSIGLESMLPTDDSIDLWPGKIANTETDFIAAAVELYQNKTQWSAAQQRGFDTVKTRYQMPRDEMVAFIAKLQQISSTLTNHRNANFIGGMLLHHHQRSTQYMAQWIEVKNQLQHLQSTPTT